MRIDKEEVGQRIKDIRIKYGYSMRAFGQVIDNAPKGSVNSWEKGVNLPNEKRLKQIATLGNISMHELLYGSFEHYIDKLAEEKLGIQLPELFLKLFPQQLQANGFTYGDEVEIIRLINGFLAFNNLVTKETAIFYQHTHYSGNYYEGNIHKQDKVVLVCKAYAEPEKDILHIIPAFGEENEERLDFYHYLKKIVLPNRHNYFTSGLLAMRGLTLRNLKIVYYEINENNYTVNIIPYEYSCEKDLFTVNEDMEYTVNQEFYREVEKEALFKKIQSEHKEK